ncbi:MAG TPA: GxxExxY protein [Victivallales bacterium]|nr:GxxExxY protein [Victivallales bacterium]HRU02246.1 GxxExxY protein [Victivallales bacterium]
MKYEEVTKKIIGCAFDVMNELGSGFLESVYEKAMIIALSETGMNIQAQHPIKVYFRNKVVGDFYSDILVENKIIVELRSVAALRPKHKAQVINYLKAIWKMKVSGSPRDRWQSFSIKTFEPLTNILRISLKKVNWINIQLSGISG